MSSCATKHYYDAQLYTRDFEAGDTYSVVRDGAVYLDKPTNSKKTLSVILDEVYLGQLQREYFNGKTLHSRHDIFRGKELWIIGKAETIDNPSALLPAESKHIGFTSVKINQSPFNTIPISENESTLFDLPAGRDYLVTFKVYEVDALKTKKFLYSQRDSDLAQWLIGATWGALKLSTDIVAKSIVNVGQDVESSEIEELLLAAKSDLEFKGQFYILHSTNTDKDKGANFALSDVIRSSYDSDGDYSVDKKGSINLVPMSRREYMSGLQEYRNESNKEDLSLPKYTSITTDDLLDSPNKNYHTTRQKI